MSGLLLGALLALSACADGKYPSLAQRPVERAMATPAIAPAPQPLAEPVSPALSTQLAALLTSARAAHRAFLSAQGDAGRLVAAAHDAPVPSDAWAAANEALAEIETNRTDLALAQDRLERLYIDDRLAHALEDSSSLAPTRPVGRAIAAARDEVLAMAEIEDAALSRLKGQMPG